MATLQALLRRHQQLLRAQFEHEQELAILKRAILGFRAPRARRKRSTKRELVETVRQTVKVLRDAGEPLPRREIAARLGLTPLATSYRLTMAMKLGFVERTRSGYYQTTNVVPAF